MICSRCNSTIPDNAMFCTVCGNRCDLPPQQARIDHFKAQSKVIAHNSLHSPLFLAMTILMTVVSVCKLFSCFTAFAADGMAQFNFDITVIFTTLTAIFSWMAYKSTDPELAGHHLRRISIYDASQWIIILVAISAIGIILVLAIALIGIGGAIISENWSDIEEQIYTYSGDIEGLEDLSDAISASANILFGVLAVTLAIVLAVMIWICIIHFKRRRFLKKAAEGIDTGCYSISNDPPYVSAIVYSILGMVGSLSSLTTALSSGGMIWFSVLGGIGLQVYIIMSAIWMSQLHRDEIANNYVIQNETAILNNQIYVMQNAVSTQPTAEYRPENNNNITQ